MSWFTDEEVGEIRKKLNVEQDFDTYKTHLNDWVNAWFVRLYRQEAEFTWDNFDILNKEDLDETRLKDPSIDFVLDKAIGLIGIEFRFLYPDLEERLRRKLKE